MVQWLVFGHRTLVVFDCRSEAALPSHNSVPVRNEVHQKYVTEEHGKPVILKLACKTRWNSLFSMLERFVTPKRTVHKAIIDIGDKNVQMTSDREIDFVRDIARCLDII